MLEASVDKRPDIYQVAHFAFALKNKSNPVKNPNNSAIPNQLAEPLTRSEAEKKKDLYKMRWDKLWGYIAEK